MKEIQDFLKSGEAVWKCGVCPYEIRIPYYFMPDSDEQPVSPMVSSTYTFKKKREYEIVHYMVPKMIEHMKEHE